MQTLASFLSYSVWQQNYVTVAAGIHRNWVCLNFLLKRPRLKASFLQRLAAQWNIWLIWFVKVCIQNCKYSSISLLLLCCMCQFLAISWCVKDIQNCKYPPSFDNVLFYKLQLQIYFVLFCSYKEFIYEKSISFSYIEQILSLGG